MPHYTVKSLKRYVYENTYHDIEAANPVEAIEIAKRVGLRLILVAAEGPYYREKVAPHVDGIKII